MYVIYYTSILRHGYVKLGSWWGMPSRKYFEQETEQQAIEFATKFRWKWLADFFCWIFQRNSNRNYEFITYTVKMLLEQ